MTLPAGRPDPWRWVILLPWSLFMAMGLFPEGAFLLLRQWGNVKTQDAMVNSYHVITLSLSAFVCYFIYQRCREAGLSGVAARGRAFQITLYALTAFWSIPLANVLQFHLIPVPEIRRLLLAAAAIKLLAWIYLWVLLIRYYCFEGPSLFVHMHSLFPSMRQHRPDAPAGDVKSQEETLAACTERRPD